MGINPLIYPFVTIGAVQGFSRSIITKDPIPKQSQSNVCVHVQSIFVSHIHLVQSPWLAFSAKKTRMAPGSLFLPRQCPWLLPYHRPHPQQPQQPRSHLCSLGFRLRRRQPKVRTAHQVHEWFPLLWFSPRRIQRQLVVVMGRLRQQEEDQASPPVPLPLFKKAYRILQPRTKGQVNLFPHCSLYMYVPNNLH